MISSSTRKPTARSDGNEQARIIGAEIPPLSSLDGPVSVLIVGEAPGPRGADKSGVPFLGDAAGKHLYLALRRLGAVTLPDDMDSIPWDGAKLRAAGFHPIANGVALTNAFNRCPTDDGRRFRAPTRDELEGPANTSRLSDEISEYLKRGLRGVVTLGKVAERTITRVVKLNFADQVTVYPVPHPSAQGLLSMAPNRGRGARMSDLQAQWMEQCMQTIRSAGFHGQASNNVQASI